MQSEDKPTTKKSKK